MTLLRLLLAAAVPAASAPASKPVYKDPAAPVEARVEDLLGRMTLEEKVRQLSGVDDMDLPANARLGIPKIRMTDGPIGVRVNDGSPATAFPSGVMSAATFDPALMAAAAKAMAVETSALGRDMLLGPCVNIARVPHGGRNFESYGEDPFLAARMSESWVKGLQGEKILASLKHYALNNQEANRMTVDVRVGERAMHELYLPAFHAAVKAGTWSVMAAYNRINGYYASENDYLQNELLKKQWGYKGFVVSDWGATHSTVDAANHGLDAEMPSGIFFGVGKLDKAVKEGKVAQAVVDDKVRRVLRAIIAGGVFDRKPSDRPARSAVGSEAHRAIALDMARKGVVLLKNDGVLPLKAKTVALIGPGMDHYSVGGGSARVTPTVRGNPLDVLTARGAPSLVVSRGVAFPSELRLFPSEWLTPPPGKGTGNGLYAEYFANKDLKGEPTVTRVDTDISYVWGEGAGWHRLPNDGFSIRWTGRLRIPAGKGGDYDVATRADDGTRLWVDGKLVIDDWAPHAPVTKSARVRLEAGIDHDIRLEYFEDTQSAEIRFGYQPPTGDGVKAAVEAATKAEAVLLFVGNSEANEGEGNDRMNLDLPPGQAELIEAVAAANKNVVVVLAGGSPFLVERWEGKARAILTAWYPGQEGARAVVDVVFGDVNPSGRTPVTWPRRWEDSPAFGRYPGGEAVEYSEGLYVGYRHFDKAKVEPRYAFGHGLSYTTFGYSKLEASAEAVSVDVTNKGKMAGGEVVQLYVAPLDPVVDRPVQELKGFARVELAPGETKRVTIKLDEGAFSHYDDTAHAWRRAPGRFSLRVGGSSRDVRLSKTIDVK